MRERTAVRAGVRKRDDADLGELARDAADGDASAFDALVRRVHALILRWARVQVGDADDAEDVTQSVLVRLNGALGTWRGEGRFETWLYRVTVNEAHGWRRRAARRLRRLERLHHDRLRSEPQPQDRGPGEVEELVRRYFQELPRRQRQVFDLVDLQGWTPAEVSETLDLNPNTVRANLFKARRALRRRILERHPGAVEVVE